MDALEEARQKKLDFFRALGQATLEELEASASKNDATSTSKVDDGPARSLPTYILNASDYSRQVSAPNSTSAASALAPCSRQMSAPVTWREEPKNKSLSMDKGELSLLLNSSVLKALAFKLGMH